MAEASLSMTMAKARVQRRPLALVGPNVTIKFWHTKVTLR